MPAGVTQLIVANRALVEIARAAPLTGGNVASNFDGSTNGIAAAIEYPGAVELLLRQQDFEFSRKVAALTLSGNVAPLGWTYEFLYPSDCMKIRQVVPATWLLNDPQSTRWDVGTSVVSAAQTTVIWTNAANAVLTYTTSNVTETNWDPAFTEEFVRYLGSILALPVAGRPDFAEKQLAIAGRLGGANSDKDS